MRGVFCLGFNRESFSILARPSSVFLPLWCRLHGLYALLDPTTPSYPLDPPSHVVRHTWNHSVKLSRSILLAQIRTNWRKNQWYIRQISAEYSLDITRHRIGPILFNFTHPADTEWTAGFASWQGRARDTNPDRLDGGGWRMGGIFRLAAG